MAQVILIESNKTMNDLISVNLTTYLGVDLIQRKNGQDTLGLLAILPSIDLIITNVKVEGEDTANMINAYLIENQLDISLVVLGGDVKNPTDNTVSIPDPKDWEEVIQITAKILGINDEILAKRSVPDYISIPVNYFLNLDSINCDVFIRIKKSATEFQFVKRIHNGDSISKELIQRYQNQGLEAFFIPKEHHRNFAIYLSNRLVEKIESPHVEENQKIQIMGESYDIAIKEIVTLGFNSETVQLTDTIIENMIKNFQKSPEVSGLLHKVINSKTGTLYQKSHMTSVVACEMIKNLKYNDTNAFDKIAFAAFFHDILLAEREDLAKINSFEELEKARLNEEDWDLVFNHASEASQLIKNHPEAPLGADEIIRHHHGAFNGKGFSNGIEKLPDLSKIFIIAHHFVLELIRFKENGGQPRPVTEELFRRYPSPDAAIIIKALEKTLKKKK
jgi:response regulator RpfG family c-di-GMP phosphodiesterase